MEYNVDLFDGLDIYQENSLTLILKQIKPGSNILEFGPAYGRMTRFLKENLGCRVSCIELNPKTKETLEKYAGKVFIGNVEDYEWVSEFNQEEFDYIILADVLEHLNNPTEVLKSIISFIKADGKILVSVPNIAHNAIIRSLYMNKFQYQEWGILDKTHVRFFAKDTLEKMILESGLYICNRFATYYNDEMTGILENERTDDAEFEALLSQRPYANVYQFVYTLCKGPITEDMCHDRIEKWQKKNSIKFYIDGGKGFSEENVYEKEGITEGNSIVEILINETEFVKSVRIDPLDECCICKVNEISIIENEETERKIIGAGMKSNALCSFDNIYIFDSEDPQFIISDINKSIKAVRVSLEILYIGITNMKLFAILRNQIQNLLNENSRMVAQIERFDNELENVKKESEERANKVAELSYELNRKEEQIFTKNLELIKYHDLNLYSASN